MLLYPLFPVLYKLDYLTAKDLQHLFPFLFALYYLCSIGDMSFIGSHVSL